MSAKLHAFDLDETLLKCNCSFAFAIFLTKRKIFSRTEFFYILCATLCFKLRLWNIKKLHSKIFFKIFHAKNAFLFHEEAAYFFEVCWQKLLNPSLISHLREIQKKRERTLLLSSSPSFLVEKIAEKLGISNVISTTYRIDASGCFQSIDCIVDGFAKAKYLRDLIHQKSVKRKEIIAYSDSDDDLPFLKEAGHAVIVNPSRRLYRIAKNEYWDIIRT